MMSSDYDYITELLVEQAVYYMEHGDDSYLQTIFERIKKGEELEEAFCQYFRLIISAFGLVDDFVVLGTVTKRDSDGRFNGDTDFVAWRGRDRIIGELKNWGKNSYLEPNYHVYSRLGKKRKNGRERRMLVIVGGKISKKVLSELRRNKIKVFHSEKTYDEMTSQEFLSFMTRIVKWIVKTLNIRVGGVKQDFFDSVVYNKETPSTDGVQQYNYDDGG